MRVKHQVFITHAHRHDYHYFFNHYVSNHDVVVISTLLFCLTARMLALRWTLGLPVFNDNHSAP